MRPRTEVAEVFTAEWPRLVATLMGDLGDLGLAEDAAQNAFVAATDRWGRDGIPDRPGAWLLTTARRSAIDHRRRQHRLRDREPHLAQIADRPQVAPGAGGDAQLAMIFGCCHRSLDEDAQVALTLRYVGGLTTAQIAHAFLVPEATMAKRLVRAKRKIDAARVPFRVPDELETSLDAVLRVIYLIFNEGYASSNTVELVRGDLCDEAAWLAQHVASLLPDQPEPMGLAALILFTDSRRATRTDDQGDLILLEDQARDRWDADKIARGHELLERALKMRRHQPFQLQAAIASVHASAAHASDTDWRTIAYLYARLDRQQPSAIYRLNGAVAVAMVDGPAAGLARIDQLGDTLDTYRYYHAARADLLRRLGDHDAAALAYRRALELTDGEVERRFLRKRLTT